MIILVPALGPLLTIGLQLLVCYACEIIRSRKQVDLVNEMSRQMARGESICLGKI